MAEETIIDKIKKTVELLNELSVSVAEMKTEVDNTHDELKEQTAQALLALSGQLNKVKNDLAVVDSSQQEQIDAAAAKLANLLPTNAEENLDKAIETGFYQYCCNGRPANSTGWFSALVFKATDKDYNGYSMITQIAFGRTQNVAGRVWVRYIFHKVSDNTYEKGVWTELTPNDERIASVSASVYEERIGELEELIGCTVDVANEKLAQILGRNPETWESAGGNVNDAEIEELRETQKNILDEMQDIERQVLDVKGMLRDAKYGDDYSREIADTWWDKWEEHEYSSDFPNRFSGDSIHYFPSVDTRAITRMEATFCESSIQRIGVIDTRNVTYANALFYGCSKLVEIEDMNFASCDDLGYAFYGCKSLVKVGKLSTPKSKFMQCMFGGCSNLWRIESLDLASISDGTYMFGDCQNLLYLNILNLGVSPKFDELEIDSCPWGCGSEENRKSLVDSLLNNSFDRAAAGYDTCYLLLSKDTIDVLTDDEFKAICNKGYSIVG